MVTIHVAQEAVEFAERLAPEHRSLVQSGTASPPDRLQRLRDVPWLHERRGIAKQGLRRDDAVAWSARYPKFPGYVARLGKLGRTRRLTEDRGRTNSNFEGPHPACCRGK